MRISLGESPTPHPGVQGNRTGEYPVSGEDVYPNRFIGTFPASQWEKPRLTQIALAIIVIL
jgi:hypothetical protein